MKELKALEILENVELPNQTNQFDIRKLKDFKYLNDQIEMIRKALTPPTADEVCDELKKYATSYKDAVYASGDFILISDNPYSDCIVSARMDFPETKLDKTKIIIPHYLPVHLVILIGRFYEGLEK